MQILLKQAEIIAALKQYISQKGIDLSGKEVKIVFTAGRKESGISADLVIEDTDIPGFTDSEESEETKPVGLTVVKTDSPKEAAVASQEAISELKESASVVEESVAKTNSLFS